MVLNTLTRYPSMSFLGHPTGCLLVPSCCWLYCAHTCDTRPQGYYFNSHAAASGGSENANGTQLVCEPFPWSANTSLTTDPDTATRAKKSIIIGIDGFAGMLAKTIVEDGARFPESALRDLVRAGALHVFEGVPTQPPTSSGPGWSSMLTGVRHAKHNVWDNGFNGNALERYPDYFAYLDAGTR